LNRKIAFALLFASILLLSPVISNVKAGDADQATWYTQVNGVLSTDYYYYPYDEKDLKIGFSKFGEKINPFTGVGLQYNGPVTDDPDTTGADPFANPGVNMNRYVQGWWLMFHYQTRTGAWRHIWAFAMFSDFIGWGSPNDGEYIDGAWVAAKAEGGWIRYASYWDPSDAAFLSPHGGRKTNAKVVTDPIKLIYEGPRGYIALVSSTIYDFSVAPVFDGDGNFVSWGAEEGLGAAVLRVSILIEFNKVKKEVIQKKDVKLLLENKDWTGAYCYLQFSERGEWDLGTTDQYSSYVHFYTIGGTFDDGAQDGLPTVYEMDNIKEGYNKKYGMAPETTISQSGFFYPYWPPSDGRDPNYYYAKAQLISEAAPYVAWASYWPHPAFWTVNGFDYAYNKIGEWFGDGLGIGPDVPLPLNPYKEENPDGLLWKYPDLDPPEPDTGLREDDMLADHTGANVEPDVPFVAAEWQALFDKLLVKEFRFVTVYGVTDLHDGEDYNRDPVTGNVIDREVFFQNDEVFNPYDLYDAVEKATRRWVEYFLEEDWATGMVTLAETPVYGWNVNEWDEYCLFAPRVLLNGYLIPPSDGVIGIPTYVGPGGLDLSEMSCYVLIGGTGQLEVWKWTGTTHVTLDDTPEDWVKVLYSTGGEPRMGSYEWIVVGAESMPIDSAGAAMVSEAFDSIKDIEVWKAGLDIKEERFGPEAPYIFVPWVPSPTTRTDYRDSIGRATLWNDFCTTNAIRSSNIIGVGGPLANLESEYLNDFTPVFYGMTDTFHYTDPAYAGKIVAGECWSRNTYGDGSAVISVYKDIDGTVHLVIWGWSGQDTYYAALWFWSTEMGWTDIYGVSQKGTPGIVYLQTENPGVVSIVLKFDYTLHFTDEGFGSIVERLGTISEKPPHQDP